MGFSELSDMRLEQVRGERDEERSARSSMTGFCPSGQHVVRRDGCGGGVCECGLSVDREEL